MKINKSERRHRNAAEFHPSLPNQPAPDFRVLNAGTISLFCPLTDACRAWVKEHITLEPWQWFANLGFAVEHRFVGNLVAGAFNDGFILGV